jgi:hypothetical protein
MLQLTRNDPEASKGLNRAALALTIYGVCVFVFWYVPLPSVSIEYNVHDCFRPA